MSLPCVKITDFWHVQACTGLTAAGLNDDEERLGVPDLEFRRKLSHGPENSLCKHCRSLHIRRSSTQLGCFGRAPNQPGPGKPVHQMSSSTNASDAVTR